MASKENGQRITNDNPDCRGVRMRFIYCSIGAAILCLGIIILIAGIVVYILTTTTSTSTNYINDFFYYHAHNADAGLNQTPVIIAIVLGSVGIAFITISLVFAILACFASDYGDQNEAIQYERQKVHYTKSGTIQNEEESLISPMIENRSNMNTSTKYLFDSAVSSPSPMLAKYEQGDINAIGLPPTPTNATTNNTTTFTSAQRHRVPPNGFSYLAHPSEIHSYHENRVAPQRNHPHQRPESNPTINNNNNNVNNGHDYNQLKRESRI